MSLLLLFSGGVPATPPAASTIPSGGGRAEYDIYTYPELRGKKKKKKQPPKELVREFVEVVADVKEQLAPKEEAQQPAWLFDLLKQDLASRNAVIAEYTQAELMAKLAIARAIMEEADDEEALLLTIQ